MKTITDLKFQRRHRGRVDIFLDGQLAFSLGADVVQQAGLEVGQDLSPAEADALAAADRRQRCREAALRLLGYRPRTRQDLGSRLRRRGFGQAEVDYVVSGLEQAGLVDDTAYARAWREERQTLNPRSGRLIELELRRKGLAPELAGQAAGEVDDVAAAYRAALKKARTLDAAELQTFRRRLGDYLRRRGFSYDVVKLTVDRLWQERHSQPED